VFVAFAGYVIYLNVVGFRPRASAKKSPAQFAEQQQHNPLVDVAEHQQQKSPDDAGFAQPVKAPSSGSPEKLKAVVLNSIPHDTAAFTQVRALCPNFIPSLIIVMAAGLVLRR
jgi:hypothetical protein